MRYIIFSRVSTDMQKVENQIKECRLYIEQYKKEGDEIYQFSEPETSSRIPVEERKVLQEMLAFLKKGDTLIVYKLDRLARKGRDLVVMYDDLTNKGVTICSIQEPTADEEYVHIIAFIAMKERTNIRVRTISGLNRKKADMERVGTTWYGYKLDETKLSPYKNAKSFGKPYLLIPNEEEQRAIQLMVECQARGMSYQDIANVLESKGYKNRKGNPFHKMSVYQILSRQKKRHQAPMDSICA